MATKSVNRDGSTATLDQRVTGAGGARQWALMMGIAFPDPIGVDFIGSILGIVNFGFDGQQYQAEFDWLPGGVILVTASSICFAGRRADADPASAETIEITGNIVETFGTLQTRPIVRPQKTLQLAATGQGTAVAIGSLPKFASRIIGVEATLVATGVFELRQERNDDATIVGRASFSQVGEFGSVNIPIVADATRIIGAETNNGIGDDVQNVRVIFELALP